MVSPVVGNPASTNAFFVQPGAVTGTPTGATGLPGTSILAAPPPSLLFPMNPAAAGALGPGVGAGNPGFSQTIGLILTLLIQALNSLGSPPPATTTPPPATPAASTGKATGNAGNAGNAAADAAGDGGDDGGDAGDAGDAGECDA